VDSVFQYVQRCHSFGMRQAVEIEIVAVDKVTFVGLNRGHTLWTRSFSAFNAATVWHATGCGNRNRSSG
jgi:hypothetical protein